MTRWRDVPEGDVRHVDVVGGPGIVVRFYDDGSVRFEHRCRTVFDRQLTSAPLLHPHHEVLRISPLTISPLILCADCMLSGFVVNSEWIAG